MKRRKDDMSSYEMANSPKPDLFCPLDVADEVHYFSKTVAMWGAKAIFDGYNKPRAATIFAR